MTKQGGILNFYPVSSGFGPTPCDIHLVDAAGFSEGSELTSLWERDREREGRERHRAWASTTWDRTGRRERQSHIHSLFYRDDSMT